MRNVKRVLGVRKTPGYYAVLCLMLVVSMLFGIPALDGKGLIQYSPFFTREAHLSPFLVVHNKDGSHRHTWLGDLAFGKDLHYTEIWKGPSEKQYMVDGVFHRNGKHPQSTRLYGGSYIGAGA